MGTESSSIGGNPPAVENYLQHQSTISESTQNEPRSENPASTHSAEEIASKHPNIRKSSMSALQRNLIDSAKENTDSTVRDFKIEQMTPQSMVAAIEEMQADSHAWQPIPINDKAADEIDQRDWDEPKRNKRTTHDMRLRSGQEILNDIKTKLDWMEKFDPDVDVVFSIKNEKTGKVEGILFMHNEEPPDICDIVTLPGTKGLGRILVEQAIKQSIVWGHAGKLISYPMGEEARRAFNAMGFERDGWTMTFAPEKSEK